MTLTICFPFGDGSQFPPFPPYNPTQPSDPPSGGGGSGGSEGGSPPPDPCMGRQIIDGNIPSGCGGGAPGGWHIDPDPILDLLHRIAVAINAKSKVRFIASTSINREKGHLIVQLGDGSIDARHEQTGSEGYCKVRDVATTGETSIGDEHDHTDDPGNTNPLNRSGPDFGDLFTCRGKKPMWVSIMYLGVVRYAFVIEDQVKAQAWFNAHPKWDEQATLDLQTAAVNAPGITGTWSVKCATTLVAILTSAEATGIGVYKSTDAEATIFVKLN